MPLRGRGQRKVEYWKYRFFYVRGGRAIRVLVLPNCSATPPALLLSCVYLRRHSSMPQKRKRTVDCQVLVLLTRHLDVLPTGSATTYGCGPNADSDNCQCRPHLQAEAGAPGPPADRGAGPNEGYDNCQPRPQENEGGRGEWDPPHAEAGDRKGTATTTAGPAFTSR